MTRAVPTPARRLLLARLGAVALAVLAAVTVVLTAALVYSWSRGGRGVPDLRVLADAEMAVVLAGWAGAALGLVVPSAAASLAGMAAWIGIGVYWNQNDGLERLYLSVQRLSPVQFQYPRSVVIGWLPDVLWPRLAWSAGLLLVAVAGLVVLAGWHEARARRGPKLTGPRRVSRPLLATGLAGLALVVVAGTRLLVVPDGILVSYADPATWQPTRDGTETLLNWSVGDGGPAHDDGKATTCTHGELLTACVYPAYGDRLARELVAGNEPVARLFAGLPDVPDRIRTVPVGSPTAPCDGTTALLPERSVRDAINGFSWDYMNCVLGGEPGIDDARAAVRNWADAVIDPYGTGAFLPFDDSPSGRAARAMFAMPPDKVRELLRPRWATLRAGKLPLSELPGAGK
jgi:hypothetical protein